MKRMRLTWLLAVILAQMIAPAKDGTSNPLKKLFSGEHTSAFDAYLLQMGAVANQSFDIAPTPGSAYHPNGRLGDLTRDQRGNGVGDLVTVLVSDKASAVSQGATNTSRKASSKQGINTLFGPVAATSPLANLAGMTGNTSLQGQGATSRSTSFSTNLTTSVTHVLPNGNLALRGVKDVWVNSEHQMIEIRGIIRPSDLAASNQISSDRLGMLEIRINGKGVVNDAVRRPFILYRLLMGLLPF